MPSEVIDLLSSDDEEVLFPLAEVAPFTEVTCLEKVLEVLPDICHEHVLGIYRTLNGGNGPSNIDHSGRVFEQIFQASSYPKDRDRRQQLKRKRSTSDDDEDEARKEWDVPDREKDLVYNSTASGILRAEFPGITVKHIDATLKLHKHLFPAYLVLDEIQSNYQAGVSPYMKNPRRGSGSERMPPSGYGPDALLKELAAAKKKVTKKQVERQSKKDKERLEALNAQAAAADGSVADCGCCFSEYPMNRMVTCDGAMVHYFCYGCMVVYIKNEIGSSKCNPTCMDTNGCGAPFPRAQLKSLLDQKTFEKLERLQQDEAIRLAGLDDLEECPFCDFKAIAPPKEVDREFRCESSDCAKVSCRLCRVETHIPLSCEEFAKENRLGIRHAVEEAMTAALVRSCNKCKSKFIKESGCNRMHCNTCKNEQCYVCSKNVQDYHHFEGESRCPLFDNVHQRHEDEVKTAETAALAKLKAENPGLEGLAEDDMKIKVSREVERAEQQRKEAAQRNLPPGHGGAFPPLHPLAGQLNIVRNYDHYQMLPHLRVRFHEADRNYPMAVRPLQAQHIPHRAVNNGLRYAGAYRGFAPINPPQMGPAILAPVEPQGNYMIDPAVLHLGGQNNNQQRYPLQAHVQRIDMAAQQLQQAQEQVRLAQEQMNQAQQQGFQQMRGPGLGNIGPEHLRQFRGWRG
ncbi:hypothetical protein B0A49_03860 [Cryomyces minteri]|uniref:RING-type domain-containing protein n=1 Tax=Cryomyces minteri TaxID=331657 RepID=A0A4U0X851_9PEZI|nr:hypothetical protein B0A49_03860 [Cryomyces minteri]